MSIARDLLISRRQFSRAVIAAAAGIAGSRTLGWTAAPRERLVVGMSIGVDSLNPYAHSDSPVISLYSTADVYAVRREVIWKPRPDEKIPVAAARFQS